MPERKEAIEVVKGLLSSKISNAAALDTLSRQLLKSADMAGEYNDQWTQRFKSHCVWLSREDYTAALAKALWLAPHLSPEDFGGARQRDLAQVWTDAIRGFLGEYAIASFLRKKFGVQTKFTLRRGKTEEFLPNDLEKVKLPGKGWRKPKLNTSVKTSKFNGRWLDAPGAQFKHSDIFVFMKVGLLREHFVSYLKKDGYVRKLLLSAEKLRAITPAKVTKLLGELPDFEPIPAFVAGYLVKKNLRRPIHSVEARVVGRTSSKRRVVITQGVGLFSPETVLKHKKLRSLSRNGALRFEIQPIIRTLNDPHFLANSGSLLHGEKAWKRFVRKL